MLKNTIPLPLTLLTGIIKDGIAIDCGIGHTRIVFIDKNEVNPLRFCVVTNLELKDTLLEIRAVLVNQLFKIYITGVNYSWVKKVVESLFDVDIAFVEEKSALSKGFELISHHLNIKDIEYDPEDSICIVENYKLDEKSHFINNMIKSMNFESIEKTENDENKIHASSLFVMADNLIKYFVIKKDKSIQTININLVGELTLRGLSRSISNVSSNKKKARQATEIWRILDNLASTDPMAYRKFIKEQMDIGKSITSPPKPIILIRASTYNKKNPFIFILLCSWSRITRDQNIEEPFNVMSADPYEVNDYLGRKNSLTKMYPLAFSDDTACEMLKNEQKQLELIDMSLEFIKNKDNVPINTDTMYEICQDSLIGSIDSFYASFKYVPFDPESEFKSYFVDPSQKRDLLEEIMHAEDINDSDQELTELSLPSVGNVIHSKLVKPVLIEECQEPMIHIDRHSRRITIDVVLESARSIADFELDVSPIALHLEIPLDKSFKGLDLEFPEPILVDSCRVTFKKKSRKLSVVAMLK